jgi:hypothetical protein
MITAQVSVSIPMPTMTSMMMCSIVRKIPIGEIVKARTLSVVIGRFQVPSLTTGHSRLLTMAQKAGEHVLVLIGSPGKPPSVSNPLDYLMREKVIRPDSPTPQHPDPADLINWTLINTPETVNVLWGDGLTPEQIKDIVLRVDAVDRKRLVFGMGGGLLQKVNRDTLRFVIKCSAVERDGQWQNVQKNPLDQTKKSKAGRVTPDTGCVVFENGVICQQETFEKIRQRAESVV